LLIRTLAAAGLSRRDARAVIRQLSRHGEIEIDGKRIIVKLAR
jgi:hypothetical protein